MKKELEFENCIIARTKHGLTCIIECPKELTDLMDGDFLDDNCITTDHLPKESGVYSCTIEFWFEQGYFEGYPADGESDYDFRIVNLKKIELDIVSGD